MKPMGIATMAVVHKFLTTYINTNAMKMRYILILLTVSFAIPITMNAQCPDRTAQYFIDQAANFPKPKYQLLAEYHTKLCPCLKGSDSPEDLKEELNVIIGKMNAAQKSGNPMPKIARCVDIKDQEPENYIEWNNKKESFNSVVYSGDIDHSFKAQLHLNNLDAEERLVKSGKKFQYIRIAGFRLLADGEKLELNKPNELTHVGIIDIENDHYYYTAKTATLKGLGGNLYELLVQFHFTGSAGNTFQNNPKYPPYELKAFFVFNPIFEM